jgi:hypothetical protein
MLETIDHHAAVAGPRTGAAWNELQSLLIDGETVVAHALQHRLHALVHRRHLAAATTGRFIFMTRRLLGGYDPVDVRWQDLREARITVGMFSASVEIEFSANLSDTATGEGDTQILRATGLKTIPAQALYRECQAQGQIWREKRRVRSIEEMRANAGGVQIATGLYPPVAENPLGAAPILAHPRDDAARRLARAKDMLAQGLITDADFEAIKARILDAL